MIYLKSEKVNLNNVHHAIFYAIAKAHEVYTDLGVYDLVITSARDSKHGDNSLHPDGKAIDIKTKTLPEEHRQKSADMIQEILGDDFDVVFEGDHTHIEFDPKN